MAALVFTAASGAWAWSSSSDCDVNLGPNWDCRGVDVFGPRSTDYTIPCRNPSSLSCGTYSWRIQYEDLTEEGEEPELPKYFYLLLTNDVSDSINSVYLNDEELYWEINNGKVYPDDGALKGRYMQWYSWVRISLPLSAISDDIEVFMQVEGNTEVAYTDSIVRRHVTDPWWRGLPFSADYHWGITTAPVRSRPGKYNTTPRADVEDIADIRVRIARDEYGCGTGVELCPDPDPVDTNACLVAWEPVVPDNPDDLEGALPIISCEEPRAGAGADQCQECKFVTEINPGWITYIFYGRPYKICGGFTDQLDRCCDPATLTCCTYNGVCGPYNPPSGG